ncbi:hypothetical protein QE449_002713 [Rhodococcus sp. SORGH_AS303]|nr:hypothetical protein [Rhodococcus sp. SORGH_AS_0303]
MRCGHRGAAHLAPRDPRHGLAQPAPPVGSRHGRHRRGRSRRASRTDRPGRRQRCPRGVVRRSGERIRRRRGALDCLRTPALLPGSQQWRRLRRPGTVGLPGVRAPRGVVGARHHTVARLPWCAHHPPSRTRTSAHDIQCRWGAGAFRRHRDPGVRRGAGSPGSRRNGARRDLSPVSCIPTPALAPRCSELSRSPTVSIPGSARAHHRCTSGSAA